MFSHSIELTQEYESSMNKPSQIRVSYKAMVRMPVRALVNSRITLGAVCKSQKIHLQTRSHRSLHRYIQQDSQLFPKVSDPREA
jgi:hypothetical protein